MKKIIILILILALTGCAHMNAVMESWHNHHYSELLTTWGPPQQVFDDGQEGRILVYIENFQWVTPGKSETYGTGFVTGYDNFIWGSVRSRTTYTLPQVYNYTKYQMFRINQKGYIYQTAWKGLSLLREKPLESETSPTKVKETESFKASKKLEEELRKIKE